MKSPHRLEHSQANNVASAASDKLFSIHPVRKVKKFLLKLASFLPAYSSPIGYMLMGAGVVLPFVGVFNAACFGIFSLGAVTLGLVSGGVFRKMDRVDKTLQLNHLQAMQAQGHTPAGPGIQPHQGMLNGVGRPAGVVMSGNDGMSMQYPPGGPGPQGQGRIRGS